MWEEACEKDLAEALDIKAGMFQIMHERHGEFRKEFPRSLGVVHALCINDLIVLSKQKQWEGDKKLQQKFIAELTWIQTLLNGDMAEVYRQAKIYQALGSEGNVGVLATYLNQWAAEKKYPPAEFDLAQGHVTNRGDFNKWRLEELAERGYVPAIEDVARRYLQGDGVEQNTGVAWYWLKRAQQENVDTSTITPKPLNRLLEEMDTGERQSLVSFAHYYDDLDLSDITIPPEFRPLSVAIPGPLSDQEVAMFVEKFDGLNRTADRKKYHSVERELVSRTAGIHYWELMTIDGQFRPFGMNNAEFVQRKCNYHREIGKIFPQGRDKIARQLRSKETALYSLFEKNVENIARLGSAARQVSAILQSGRLCPNPESKAITHALVWAKRLDKMDPDALRKLATMHFEKSGSVSKTRFQLDESNNHIENKLELVRHYLLAGTIQKFAKYKERGK